MYEKESNGYLVLFVWVVFLIFGIYLFQFSSYKDVKEFSQNADMPEELFGVKNDYFYTFLDKIGEAGTTAYYNFLLLDYVNLLLLGFTLFITIRHFLVKLKANNWFYIVLIFPVLFVLFDVSENSLLLYLIHKLPSKFHSLTKLASDFTVLKMTFFTISFLSLLISGLVLLFKTLYQKKISE